MRIDQLSGKKMKQKVDDYLKLHGLGLLFEGMTAALLLHKPAEPCKFLAEYLTGLQSQGAQPALTREELRIMFGMFDVTEKGTVSVAQANQALKTLVGQDADLQSKDAALRPDKTLGCEVFVAQMHGALRAAAPTLAEAAK
ncbi:hypothetical protein WJX79_009305 [Trebouxia sp. C0005]